VNPKVLRNRAVGLLPWALPAVAILMLALILTPESVWSHPVNDQVYRGFDSNVMYAGQTDQGIVQVSSKTVSMSAARNAQGSINLLTTPFQRFNAVLNVSIVDNSGGSDPLRIGVWTPWTKSGYFLLFEPAPSNAITIESIEEGDYTTTLATTPNSIVHRTHLGTYSLGSTYRVNFLVDRGKNLVSASVSGDQGLQYTAKADPATLSALFRSVRLSLTASTQAADGTSRAVLSNYTLALPHEKFWASKTDDPKAQIGLVALALAGLVLLAMTIISRFASLSAFARRLTALRPRILLSGGRRRMVLLVVVATVFYFAGNALLFALANDPFDISAERLYAYVAWSHGPAQLYYIPNIVSLAKIWHGTPIEENGFAYQPMFGYLALGIGWIYSHLFSGGGPFVLDTWNLAYVIKSVNVLFGFADGVLVYLIARQIGVSEGWSRAAAALLLFNPAVWFSMSIWGQTHVISVFFILAAILLAEKQMPFGAWLLFAAGCLTRPQMLVFVPILTVIFLRKFPWRQNVMAISQTVIAVFILLLPFTLATGPSLPVDIVLNNFHVQEGSGNDAQLNPVAQDSYSVWPLVTYVLNAKIGQDRIYTPSSTPIIGSLTYQRLGLVLTSLALLALTVLLLFRKRSWFSSGGYVPFVALSIASFLMLLTGILSTYFLLALPFLLLCRRWLPGSAYLYVALIWTITTFVPMYGDLGTVITRQDYPLLAAANNDVTKFFVNLHAWDRFITTAVVANIVAVTWLAVSSLRPSPKPKTAAATTA
jgi:hypothetical protein